MKIYKDISTLPRALQDEILENSRDMRRFYTLTTDERDNVLGRISMHNSMKELEQATKKD